MSDEEQIDQSGEKQDKEITYISEIIQIRKIVSKKKKKEMIRTGGGWNGNDYNYSIKWEFAYDTSKGELVDYRFLLKTYEIGTYNKLIDVSKEYEWVYESIEIFPQIVAVEDNILISDISK